MKKEHNGLSEWAMTILVPFTLFVKAGMSIVTAIFKKSKQSFYENEKLLFLKVAKFSLS